MTVSLLLDRTTWDLCLDAAGNLAIASEPYRIAQDVACACQVQKGELWYDTTQGLPYQTSILGYNPPLGFLKQQYVDAALSVPGVASAQCFIASVVDRELTGQVQFATTSGQTGVVAINGSEASPLFAVTDTGQFGVTDRGFSMVTDTGASITP